MAAIKCIGVLTSGGDAPGMNAAIRAVTRTAIYNGYSVKGIMRGYKGLVDNEIVDLQSDSVSNIIQQGGTMLKTARSQEFMTPEGRRRAYENMKRNGIDALVVIGGDGSLKGACIFAQEFDVPIVGLPGTIDNDLGVRTLRSATIRRSIRLSRRWTNCVTRLPAMNASSSSRLWDIRPAIWR